MTILDSAWCDDRARPAPARRPIDSVVVVVPVHNERRRLPACLTALDAAAAAVPQRVRVVVVLDACDDGSAELVGDHMSRVRIDAQNVGAARRAGFASLRELPDPAATWFATTDADSDVPSHWLRAHLAAADGGADAYVGTVTPTDFDEWPSGTAERYFAGYDDTPGHRHVHGANLGIRASVYTAVGGFAPLPAHEDVDLVSRLTDGSRSRYDGPVEICWDAGAPVRTSTRRTGRVAEGFWTHLRDLSGNRR